MSSPMVSGDMASHAIPRSSYLHRRTETCKKNVRTSSPQKCAQRIFLFFMMYPGLGQLVGSIIVGYYRLQDRRVDLTQDTDSSDESSVHTPLDYDDPDNNWV